MSFPSDPALQCSVSAALLKDVAVAANEALDSRQAMSAVLRLVCDASGWPVAHAMVLRDGQMRSTGLWQVADEEDAALAAFREASAKLQFGPGVGLPGQALASGGPIWITDTRQDASFVRAETARAAGLAAAFAFPVRCGNDVVAVLEFFASVPYPPRDEVTDLMAYVGVQLGRVFEREFSQHALRESDRRNRAVLDNAGDAFIGMDAQGRVSAWNTACERTFGWRFAEAMGRLVSELIVPEPFRVAHQKGLERAVAGGPSSVLGHRLELPALHRDGHEFPIEITLWSLDVGDGRSFYAFARDITERKAAERELEYKAMHDALTGLPNRTLLTDRLEQLLARRSGDAACCALLFVDLDHFKRINDSLGHEAGNQLLRCVAQRLEAAVRPADTVARLAGDEFVVLCAETQNYRDAAVIAQRLLDDLASPILIQDQSIFLTASVGIALADVNTDPETLIGAADTAMYEAKSSGRGHFELFDERMRMQVTNRLRVESDLRQALDRDQLCLHFQPIIDAKDYSIVALEALLRWEHPQRGMISPAEFIPIAEETGLIVPIGAWVLTEACRHAARWGKLNEGRPCLGVSVNLSGRQLGRADLVPTMDRIVSDAGLDPSWVRLGVEVTETVVMQDPIGAARTLQALRELGVHLSIDDFGTGYSSLAYLKRFPVDTIKIDRAFVTSLADDYVDRAIVGSVVQLASALNLWVVAEGVETEQQAEALRKLGVHRMQGFLFACPQPARAIDAMLAGGLPQPGRSES